MANTLLTPAMITREALRVLHNNLIFCKGANRQYSEEFAKTGAKIGSTINVRKPNRYFVRKGPVMQTQNTNEQYVPLTLNTQWGTDISFSSAELTLSLDDFSKRILTPAMARIAAQIDYDGLAQFVNVYNQVGLPGSAPGTATGGTGLTVCAAPDVYLNSGMLLDNNACPRDENRRVIINPIAMATSVKGLSGLLNDQGTIGEQYKKGLLGEALGFVFAMDQNVNTLTTGDRSSATMANFKINGANQTGSAITVTGTTSLNVAAGEVVQFAGVYSVNPENQQSTGQLAQFVVTSALAAGGTTLNISPPIKLAGTGVADGTVTALPADQALITCISNAGTAIAATTTPVNLAYHQDAFTLGTADLEVPGGVDFASRETYDGISMRIVRAFDINNDQFPCRIDVLGGYATLRPELACRIVG